MQYFFLVVGGGGGGVETRCIKGNVQMQPEKTADIWQCYHWFPRQMTSEKRAHKFHTDDA